MDRLLDLPISKLILASRPWLHRIVTQRGAQALALWLVDAGFEECPTLRPNRELREFLAGEFDGSGATRLEALLYCCRPEVRETFELRSPQYREWCRQYATEKLQLGALPSGSDQSDMQRPTVRRPFGVNVIGHVFCDTGLGEEARMAARALQAADVPFTIISAVPSTRGEGDRSMESHVTQEGPYEFNLLCMTPYQTADWFLSHGAQQRAGRFNIGQWWWELEAWPREWLPAFELVDEVWAPSRFILDGVRKVSPVHCEYMPSAVELGEVNPRTRADFGLPDDTYLFYAAFDMNSLIARKNPRAAIAAFQAAFPPGCGQRVGLVIKSQRPQVSDPAWDELLRIVAADERIRVIGVTFVREDLLALYKACDCYVSLHRSEGFGRNIAEAMLLGRHVIATDYSGNTDFCREPHAFPVRAGLVPIKPGEYLVDCDAFWAEPDIAHAAAAMRRALESGPPPPLGRALPGRGVDTIGAAYAARLRTLHEQRLRENAQLAVH